MCIHILLHVACGVRSTCLTTKLHFSLTTFNSKYNFRENKVGCHSMDSKFALIIRMIEIYIE